MKNPLEHDRELMERKPAVPGKAAEYIYIPSRGFMTGRLVTRGQVIRIIDLEGQQVPDITFWDASDLDNVLNAFNTMAILKRWTKLPVGSGFYSKNCDKLAIISDDTTDGTHNLSLGAFCNEPLNRVRYGVAGTPNCHDNLVSAMAPYGFSATDIDWNSVMALFMDVRHEPDGSMEYVEPHTKPGDYIDLMAEMDIIVAISNCPQERSPVNAYNPTPIMAVIFNPNEEYKARVEKASKSSQ